MGRNEFVIEATWPDRPPQRRRALLIREEPGYVPPPIAAEDARPGELIDDFTDTSAWRAFGSDIAPEAISMEATDWEGRHAMVVRYDAEKAGTSRASVGRNIPQMGRERVGLHFWLYGDGSGAQFHVELCEKDWPNWSHPMTLDFTGWREFDLTWEDFSEGSHDYSRNAKPDWDTIFWLALNPREKSTTFAISDLRYLVPKQ
jgi:hypothetical protein